MSAQVSTFGPGFRWLTRTSGRMSKSSPNLGDLALREVGQRDYGNDVFYPETLKADKDEYKFSVDYDVVRKEHVVLVNGKSLKVRSSRPPRRCC